MGFLHRVGHMIDWFFNDYQILCRELFLLKYFLQPCDQIAHHICMMHAGVFYGKIRRLS